MSMTVLYDGSCPLCRRSAAGIARLDRRRVCLLVDASDLRAAREAAPGIDPQALAEALHVVDEGGRVRRGFDALRALAVLHPLGRALRPFLYVPGVGWLGERAYRALARRRHRLFARGRE